jgi:hypothetical protein
LQESQGRRTEVLPGSAAQDQTDRRDLVESYLDAYPDLRDKIIRQLLLALHKGRFIGVDAIYREAQEIIRAANPDRGPEEAADEPEGGEERATGAGTIGDDGVDLGDDPGFNRGFAHRWDSEERAVIDGLVITYAARHLTVGELDSHVLLTRKRSEARSLTDFANHPELPIDTLAEKLAEYCNFPGEWLDLPEPEALGLRVAILRRFVSEQLDFLGVAKRYLTIPALNRLMQQAIGVREGTGRLGGKAAGMVLAESILHSSSDDENDFRSFKTPESIFLRTDLFMEFMKMNGLMEYYDQKYKSIDDVRAEFPAVREVFKNAEFPEDVTWRLREFLERVGTVPLIVRSSSLLEDNFSYAFSGKYASIFLGNQGSLQERLHELLGAVAEVYASTLGPDPIAYRHAKKLIDYDEMMGVIIQRVVGKPHGRYFLPAWAGVAFSHNEYRWNKRIRKEDGLMRLVMGLGSRAVDRVGGDYPRMVALGLPTLRPESTVQDACRYSQRYIDVIDLKKDEFRSIPLARLLEEAPYSHLFDIVSIHKDGELRRPVSRRLDEPPEHLVITFENLLRSPEFVARIRAMLSTLERAYGRQIDVEFAFDGEDFYILQCRPLSCRIEIPDVRIPADVAPEDRIFTAERHVSSAELSGIEYIVYIDPIAYDRLETHADRQRIAQIVGRLNAVLEAKAFILMGPGRWGSSDIRLGVRVTYADINHTKLLVEIARTRGDYEPDVSFGTHFFQDLVESGIHHLALYPDHPTIVFNEGFLRGSENVLAKLVPEYATFEGVVRVIHVPSASRGRLLNIAMDGRSERALGYLSGSS